MMIGSGQDFQDGRSVAYVGIGSNVGDRMGHLRSGVEEMGRIGEVVGVSSVFETEPHDVEDDQRLYLNMAVALKTELSASELMDELLGIESRNGRVRSGRNASRTLDLDILLVDGLVVDNAGLKIPHPRMHERGFVLAPLREIAADVVHPLMGVSVASLADRVGTEGVRMVGGWVG